MAAPGTSQMPVIVVQKPTGGNHSRSATKYVVFDAYESALSTRLGGAVMAMAIACIGFTLAGTGIQAQRYWDDWNYYYYFQTGTWCPIFYFLAGGFGIGAARRRNGCMIRANLAMSILCFVAGLTDVIMASSFIANEIQKGETDDQHEVTIAMMFMSGCCSLVVVCLCIPLGHLSGQLICNGLLTAPTQQVMMYDARTNQLMPHDAHQQQFMTTSQQSGPTAPGMANVILQPQLMDTSGRPYMVSPQPMMNTSGMFNMVSPQEPKTAGIFYDNMGAHQMLNESTSSVAPQLGCSSNAYVDPPPYAAAIHL